MKKYIIIFFCILISGCNSYDPQIKKSLKDATFWEWNSPYGKFNIHYIEIGQGTKNVLLIHGFGANTYTWHGISQGLANNGYHVWNIDLIGFGLSDKPSPDIVLYGLNTFIHQIQDFIKAQKLNPINLIGNSMGGGLSLYFALDYHQEVKSLILIDTLAYPLQLPLPLRITRIFGKAIAPFQGPFLVRKALERVVYDHNKITEEQVMAYTIPLLMPGGQDAFLATLNSFDPKQLENLQQHLKNINLPVLIIWGGEDHWIPISQADRLVTDLPHAKKIIIPKCGHIPQEECPQVVLDAILPFLKSTNSTK